MAIILGMLSAFVLHWFSWLIRLKRLPWAVGLGIACAAGLTFFSALFMGPYTGEIAGVVLIGLIFLWVFAGFAGALQAISLRVPWWQGLFGFFFEAGLAFLVAAGVNLGLQAISEQLGFDNQFPETSVYFFIDRFLLAFTATLLLLAVLRPLLRLYWSRRK